MRTKFSYIPDNIETFKNKILVWSQQFREVVFLDSNQTKQNFSSYDCILAVDAFTSIKTDYFNAFDELDSYQSNAKDWLFGYLTYDLKNNVEDLNSSNIDGLKFPDLFFFQPKKLFLFKDNYCEILYLSMCDDEYQFDIKDIINSNCQIKKGQNNIEIKERISKEDYISKVNSIKQSIQLGDIYEANFCMEFFAENSNINPLEMYFALNKISKAPFASFLKLADCFLISASPERFLKKEKDRIISQPIKGTSKRFDDSTLDLQSKTNLENNEKERSENIMIVDLVRNDLSKTAQKNSVEVVELCKVYTYPQVHQMISTIQSKVQDGISPVKVIKEAFPMGSMTGAPKIAAMQIIENHEESKRGLYSGSVGYFDPNGDFDFNVVIRSILYNQSENFISYSVGSAITSKSDAEAEYQECMIKAKAMKTVLLS